MSLEFLANELLLNMFEYPCSIEFLQAFHCLNIRFDNLIFIHFQTYRLDFRAASKKDFDVVYRINLPLINNPIVFLALSNDNETCQQIDLFYFCFEL
jgi:hypothetical protein